jgi:septum formation protein
VDDAELAPGAIRPEQWAAALAYLKARAGAAAAHSGPSAVLGADTVCVKEDRFIGQPVDEADARRILRLLEGGEHDVITGVALVAGPRRQIGADRARVRMGTIGEARLEAYLASGQWRGKAGAYNLSERIAAGWPIEYDGDPTTIMGLPMRLLSRLLAAEQLMPQTSVA